MKKRAAATLLWFYTAWYAGAMIASFMGVSEVLGPILGTAAAALVGGDPRGIFWKRTTAGESMKAAGAQIQNPAWTCAPDWLGPMKRRTPTPMQAPASPLAGPPPSCRST